MSNQKQIKKRVESVGNIQKITKALEMVAASRVKKAQDKAVNSKPYANTIFRLVREIGMGVDVSSIPLMKDAGRKENSLFVLISTNKGLCGSLNNNLFKKLNSFLGKSEYKNFNFITLGKKGRGMAASRGKLIADFSDDTTFDESVVSVVKMAVEGFIEDSFDEVNLVYTDFVSPLVQEPTIKRLLPVVVGQDEEEASTGEEKVYAFNFDLEADKLLNELLRFYLEVQVKEAILEAEASEHSARMLAMKSATDNAQQLNLGLTLEYNSVRQQSITTEISDITTAKMALED